jgi:hypothetical protein
MRERLNDLASQAAEGYSTARDSAMRGMRSAYNSAYSTARDYPGTLAAIVVGVGITAFLLWAARRAGGWRNLQDSAMDRMREGYGYARDAVRSGAARIRREAPEVAE